MNRREWLAAAVITVLAVAVAGYLLRDGGNEPERNADSDPPSASVMSSAAADQLVRRLTREGWSCYDSLRDPVVKRCFSGRRVGDGGSVSAEVALTFVDDYVARANVYVAGEHDAGQHVEIAEKTARIVGDTLLDGAGATLVDRLGRREEVEVAGRRVFGHRAPGSSIQVVAESASYDAELPPPDLPREAALVRTAEAAGLTCDADGSSTTCSDSGSPGMTVTMSKASGRLTSVTVSASNAAVPNDPVVTNMVVGYLFETGLGGQRAPAWVRSHAASAVPVRADLGGVHLRVGGRGDRAVYLIVSAITN